MTAKTLLAACRAAVAGFCLVTVAFYTGCEGGGSGGGESSWVFVDDGVDLGIAGVSPEAVLLDDGSVRLYVTGMGISVYRAGDGLTFAGETASVPQGSDPSLIRVGSGYRMYYVGQESGTEEILTATSSDGLHWTVRTGTGIRNPTGTQAWGVPDTITLPDGRVRIYWVDSPQEGDGQEVAKSMGGGLEVIKSAISSDGTTFTEESGYRTQDGYVDPYILHAEDGNWIGLFSTTPNETQLPQKIYVGTSANGLDWTLENEPVITVSGGNALDPTAIPLGDGSYRVYYIATPGSDPFSGHFLKSGVLRPR